MTSESSIVLFGTRMKLLRLATVAAFAFCLLTLSGATQGQSPAKKMKLQNGQTIRMKCADDPDDPRWLCAGDEGLTLSTKADDVGNLWRVYIEANAIFLCNVSNPKRPRWLHGLTHLGSLELVDNPKGKSGCQWEFVHSKDALFEVKCLGHLDGARWLDAIIPKEEIRLQKKSDVPVPMKWEVESVKVRK